MILLALVAVVGAGCTGRYRGPRTLGGLGLTMTLAGSATWAAGENTDGGTGRALTGAGLAAVALGLAAIVAAGGWMAASASCHADPDCPDDEECREVPAPAGFIPYKQCMPRQP